MLGSNPESVGPSDNGARYVGRPLRYLSNIISLPLAFVRSGYVGLNDGGAYDVGRSPYSWSRVTTSASGAYDLSVYPTGVYPSNSDSRWYGFPIRWLSNIISLPLAFVRSGNVNLNDGRVYGVGEWGYGWTRVTRSASVADFLGVNPTEVHPSNFNYRYYGFPLHCLCMLKGI